MQWQESLPNIENSPHFPPLITLYCLPTMNILFIVFHGFSEHNGISKKISCQVEALRKCGADVHLCHYEVTPSGQRMWMVNGHPLANLGYGWRGKLRKRTNFSPLLHYAESANIDAAYIRSFHNANPFTLRLAKGLKRLGVHLLLEIPTYPYDGEYHTIKEKAQLLTDRLFRRDFCRYMDAIVTFSDHTQIFGRPTLCLSNGIDFHALSLHNATGHDLNREIHLVAVAEIHFWHGYDRLIHGLAEYYQNDPACKVYFHLAGEFSGKQEAEAILTPIRRNKLEPYVILHGPLHGMELDALFNQADLAIGSLGRHRCGIFSLKALKNREYAARGLAFVCSEHDTDFDLMPYVLRIPADESPVDIDTLLEFVRRQPLTSMQIRSSVAHLAWERQMQTVFNFLKNQPL